MSRAPKSRPAFNPWFVAIAVVVPTFMEVLDTTIANVALRYIAGGLSTAESQSEWVITSYLAANAVVLTISGWLSVRLGRRNYFLLSIAVFTFASALCGMATSLTQIVAFRILQGLAGGGLQPSSQGILVDTFPSERRGTAMTLFGIAALIGPIVGPTLGGYLVVSHSWRWIFYINVPVGIVAFLLSYFLVRDPEYLIEEREELRKKPFRLDFIGLGLLTLAVASWETLLSKGQEWDWTHDPFGRVQTLIALFVFGLALFIIRSLRNDNPLINIRVLLNRNLAAACVIMFFAFAALFASTIALPSMVQLLLGYDAYQAGLILSPSGFSSIGMMIVVGFLMSRHVDARWLIGAGLATIAASSYWMSQLNILVDPWHLIWPRMVLTAGVGLIFAPINTAALKYVPQKMMGSAIALLSVLRNEGGGAGTSMSTVVVDRRLQFHTSRLNDNLDGFNHRVTDYIDQTSAHFQQYTGDEYASRQMALETLENLRNQQALTLAYLDLFWLAAIAAICLVPLIFLMRRSVAEKATRS